jgi:proline racemase
MKSGPLILEAIDLHAAGEPGRVIVGGLPDIPGASMFDKKLFMEEHLDWIRRLMLREPRGYPALCCNALVPATHPDADAGFVIMEHREYPPMSGSNTLCVATALIESAMVPVSEPETRLVLEAPAGLVAVQASVERGKATAVTFRNVPAVALHLDRAIQVPELGEVVVDVAYGGMMYVIADADRLGVDLVPGNGARIARVGELIKQAAREQIEAVHPSDPRIRGITIAQLAGKSHSPGTDGRNAVVVPTGDVRLDDPATWTGCLDRSPCGTGTCARMAALHARGLLGVGDTFVHEGILGTRFTGTVEGEAQVGDRVGIVPSITGTAWITGRSRFSLDPSDPFPQGFTVGDLWGAGSPSGS